MVYGTQCQKCKVMHTGYKPTHMYGRCTIQQISACLNSDHPTERDLGFQMSADLKCHEQA